MLKIRLHRVGKKKKAFYRVVVTEHTKKPTGKYVELLGSYDPHAHKLTVESDRVTHWMSVGVQPSATVHNLLVSNNVIDSPKVQSWKPKVKPQEEEKKEVKAPDKQEDAVGETPPEEPSKDDSSKDGATSNPEKKAKEPKAEHTDEAKSE